MSVQFIYDVTGRTTAVIVPIEEWNKLATSNKGDILESDLLPWQLDLIEENVMMVQHNAERYYSLEEILADLAIS